MARTGTEWCDACHPVCGRRYLEPYYSQSNGLRGARTALSEGPEMQMWDNYDEIKENEAKLDAKLLKKSRAMQKAEKAAGTTLATIDENVDEELDVESEGFKQLAAFFKKDAAKTQKSKGIKKNSTKTAKDSAYVDIKDIQEKAFKSCYTTQEWTKRRQAREQNEEYSKQPHLYSKDKLKGKLCCVKCRRVGHTARVPD